MCCRDVDTDLDARRFVLGQNVAQHIAQATEHGQHALAALAALGVRAEQQPNASGVVVQRIAALHILGQDAAREREREQEIRKPMGRFKRSLCLPERAHHIRLHLQLAHGDLGGAYEMRTGQLQL